MSSDSRSPSESPSPSTQQFKRKRMTVPKDHKDMLKYIMFEEDGGNLNKAYQRGVKKLSGNSMSSFWLIITKKLNKLVHPQATYTQEVMIVMIVDVAFVF